MNLLGSDRVQSGGAGQPSCHREELGKQYLSGQGDGHEPLSSESCLLPSSEPRDQADDVGAVDLVKKY